MDKATLGTITGFLAGAYNEAADKVLTGLPHIDASDLGHTGIILTSTALGALLGTYADYLLQSDCKPRKSGAAPRRDDFIP